MRIGKDGDLLVVGRPAQVLRLLILSRPAFYAKVVAPYLQSREASFRPDELWFDPQGRIHLTNKRILARARHHLAKAGRSLRKAQ